VRDAAVRERRGVVQRTARDHVRRRDVVGKDVARRILAAGELRGAGDGERAADQLHELAARGAVELAGSVGELAVDRGLHGLGVVVLFDAAPAFGGNRSVGLALTHRWHVVQEVRLWTSLMFCGFCAVFAPESEPTPGITGQPYFSRPSAVSIIVVMNSFGRRFGDGLRWHSRHQPICIVGPWRISGISSTRPWQVTQPTPLATWIEWLK